MMLNGDESTMTVLRLSYSPRQTVQKWIVMLLSWTSCCCCCCFSFVGEGNAQTVSSSDTTEVTA
jgi:streptolysin S family bacteriocin protoxin